MRLRLEAANVALGVEDGVIVPPTGRFDVSIRMPEGELRPGLINAHDHLHRNHYGRLGHPPYADSYEWGTDIHARDAVRIAAGRALPRRDALLRGAWKNLLSGVTTVVHHDAWEPAFENDFPVRVAPLRTAHSLGLEPALPDADGAPFAIHLAEGVHAASAAEVCELARRGRVDRLLLAVHVVGADATGSRLLREAGAAIVWCPSSNLFLFECTTPADLLAPGIDVLLGSDSLLTGAGSLLEEIAVARTLGLISPARLEDSVGAVAARRLGLPPPSLNEGAAADLVMLTAPLLDATSSDVALVMVDGVLRVLHPVLLPAIGALAGHGMLMQAAGRTRWVSGQGARMASSPPRNDHRVPSMASSRRRRA
jgi:hypothetical protein